MEIDAGDKEILRKALEELAGSQRVVQFLSNHFRDKYHLDANNQVTPTGEIISVSPFGGNIKQNATPQREISESHLTEHQNRDGGGEVARSGGGNSNVGGG